MRDYATEVRTEIFPTDHSPVVTRNGDTLAFEHAKFGFASWDGKGRPIINARSEIVHEKPMFRKHVQAGRCVIPASGYFEWQAREGRKKKIKHLIKDAGGNLLFMAGLWREGKDGREFVIITKDPVGDVVKIHDRMPVMLRTDQLDAWLSGAMPIEELASLEYICAGEPCEESVAEQMSLSDLT